MREWKTLPFADGSGGGRAADSHSGGWRMTQARRFGDDDGNLAGLSAGAKRRR